MLFVLASMSLTLPVFACGFPNRVGPRRYLTHLAE